MSLREKFVDTIIDQSRTLTPMSKGNKDKVLWNIYYWQEIQSLACNAMKGAWRAAQEMGVIDSDDDMRALGEGEHMVVDSQLFSVLAKVTKPRELFDRDLFIAHLVKKYKLEKSKLEAIAEDCKVPSQRALSKRVVEAAK